MMLAADWCVFFFNGSLASRISMADLRETEEAQNFREGGCVDPLTFTEGVFIQDHPCIGELKLYEWFMTKCKDSPFIICYSVRVYTCLLHVCIFVCFF